MNAIAAVFPGQGAQARGMGQALCAEFALARETFAEASEALGLDLGRLCFEDPDRQLELTTFTQPAVLTMSLAAWRVLAAETGLRPAMAAGHSLGEYTALAAAGALTLPDAVRLVAARARAMEKAVPAGEGAMAAVMGVAREEVFEACNEATGLEVVIPANINGPDQIVISGHVSALERAMELLKARGAKVRRLKVSGPFHSPLMQPATISLAEIIKPIPFSAPLFPVLANLDAKPHEKANLIPSRLLLQLTSPVHWHETMMEMDRRGADLYIECGPGTVLSGLIKRALPKARVLPMSEPRHLAAISEALNGR
jgi:[acyl-carrier-protein] S-malonyltransferase